MQYIRKISSDTVSFEYLVTQHLRMSGVYWGLTALSILGSGLEDNDIASESNALNVSTVDKTIIDWIMSCQDSESGGYTCLNYYYYYFFHRIRNYIFFLHTVSVEIRVMILISSIRSVLYKF